MKVVIGLSLLSLSAALSLHQREATLLADVGQDEPTYTRHLFENATARGAVANDGSPAGYYTSLVPGSTKWLIFLEGGGLCVDPITCSSRPKDLYSSTGRPATLKGVGILGSESTFTDFNRVFIMYLTSDLYSGQQPQGSSIRGWSFLGSNIVRETIVDLRSKYDFDKGTELLFSGGSAGGVGTFMNYPLVKETVTWMPVKALPDAGWFMNGTKAYETPAVPLLDLVGVGLKNWKGAPPSNCMKAFPSQPQICYTGVNVYPFMPGSPNDIMVLKAADDAWTTNYFNVQPPYDAGKTTWLETLSANTRGSFVKDSVPNVYSAGCVYHTAATEGLWQSLKVNGKTMEDAVSEWYFKGEASHYVDSCTSPNCSPGGCPK